MHRQFNDDHGQSWQVWETRPSKEGANVSERNRDGWLAFESLATTGPDAAQRLRLVPIPHGWERANDATLREFLSRAVPAPPRRIDPSGRVPRIGGT